MAHLQKTRFFKLDCGHLCVFCLTCQPKVEPEVVKNHIWDFLVTKRLHCCKCLFLGHHGSKGRVSHWDYIHVEAAVFQ